MDLVHHSILWLVKYLNKFVWLGGHEIDAPPQALAHLNSYPATYNLSRAYPTVYIVYSLWKLDTVVSEDLLASFPSRALKVWSQAVTLIDRW